MLDTARLLPPSLVSALATFRHSSRNISRCFLHRSKSNLDFKDGLWVVGHLLDTPTCVGYSLGVLDTVSLLPFALALVRAGDIPAPIKDYKQACSTGVLRS